MEISYLGHSSFLLKHKEVKLVCDPVGEAAGFKQTKVEADIVTISHNHHDDHNVLTHVTGEPRIIDGPGEYEVKGVTIIGIASWHDDKEGKERGRNTIYSIHMDEISVCHLGDLGHPLSESQLSKIGDVDVLMVPVGGTYSLDPATAWKVVEQISPYMVVPMHYKTNEHKNAAFAKLNEVDDFVKISGLEPKHLDKLTLKKTELTEEQLDLVILSRYGR